MKLPAPIRSVVDRFTRGTTALTPPRAQSAYMRGGKHMVFSNWMPALRKAQADVAQSWDKAAARSIDLIQNSGWVSGMVDQAVANTVGTGLRLRATPDHEELGITADEARELGQLFERRFRAWASNPQECDVEGKFTFAQLQASAFRAWFATGEIWEEFVVRNRLGTSFQTKVRVFPATRIAREDDRMRRLVSGVYLDADDRAIGYRACRENQFGGVEKFDVTARDPRGRARVAHVFDGVPGQVRGISPMVPALMVAKLFDQLSDATITSWLIQTIFAASVTSDEPTEDILQSLLSPQEQAKMTADGGTAYEAWFDAMQGWYDGAPLDLGVNGRIAHLFPGQKMEFLSAENDAADYKTLATLLLRETARCLGLTYESGTGDYEGATYSSVRMATSEIFQITLYRRANIIRPMCQPAYEAVIEEEIARGRITVPGGYSNFIAKRSAFCRSEWRGSPQPQADDLKTAKKHQIYQSMGVVTDEMIAQDLGTDVETVYQGRAREKAMREKLDLPEAVVDPNAIKDVPAAEDQAA